MSEDILNDDVIPADLENSEAVVVEEDLFDVDPIETPAEEPVQETEIKEDVVEISEAVEETSNNVVSSAIVSEDPKPKKPSIEMVNGAIGSSGADKKDKVAPKPKKKEVETVAIFSTRNVTWNGVGKVYRGYNIVTPEQAEQWLKRDHTRLATPEEVAKEFNL